MVTSVLIYSRTQKTAENVVTVAVEMCATKENVVVSGFAPIKKKTISCAFGLAGWVRSSAKLVLDVPTAKARELPHVAMCVRISRRTKNTVELVAPRVTKEKFVIKEDAAAKTGAFTRRRTLTCASGQVAWVRDSALIALDAPTARPRA